MHVECWAYMCDEIVHRWGRKKEESEEEILKILKEEVILFWAARERLSQESLLDVNLFPGLAPVNYLWLILWASSIFISGGRSKSSSSCASCWKSVKIQLGSACKTNLQDSAGIASFPGTQKAFGGFDT